MTPNEAPALTVRVLGIPAPQGSKKGFRVGNRVAVVDDNKATLSSWRHDVATAVQQAALQQGWVKPEHAVAVTLTFHMPRPKSWPKVDQLPRKKPDLDKLVRAVFDALTTGGAYRDDAQVVSVDAAKVFAAGDTLPGVEISVRGIGR